MKRWTAFLLMLVMCLPLCACKKEDPAKDPLKASLCRGNWVYQQKSGGWYYTEAYVFRLDGTCDYIYNEINEEDYTDEDLEPIQWSGTWKLDTENGYINVTFQDGSAKEDTIPYYLNEFNHEMVIHADSEGNSDWVHNLYEAEINYVW